MQGIRPCSRGSALGYLGGGGAGVDWALSPPAMASQSAGTRVATIWGRGRSSTRAVLRQLDTTNFL